MARKSKLTDKQWHEIEQRHLSGESIRSLAKEYGLAPTAISKRISAHTNKIKSVAKQLVEVESQIESLPISAQISVRTLADDLKAISANLASAARYGAMTAHRMAALANQQAEFIDDANPVSDVEVIKGVAALTKLSNDASEIPMKLIAASQKDGLPAEDEDGGRMSDARLAEVGAYVKQIIGDK